MTDRLLEEQDEYDMDCKEVVSNMHLDSVFQLCIDYKLEDSDSSWEARNALIKAMNPNEELGKALLLVWEIVERATDGGGCHWLMFKSGSDHTSVQFIAGDRSFQASRMKWEMAFMSALAQAVRECCFSNYCFRLKR